MPRGIHGQRGGLHSLSGRVSAYATFVAIFGIAAKALVFVVTLVRGLTLEIWHPAALRRLSVERWSGEPDL
jgi:hypothetical protein